jgi:hypothetical protein
MQASVMLIIATKLGPQDPMGKAPKADRCAGCTEQASGQELSGRLGRQRGKAKAPHHNYNPVKIVPYTATCGSLYPGGMQCGVYRTGGRNEW